MTAPDSEEQHPDGEGLTPEEEAEVKAQYDDLKAFVGGLSTEELRDGRWFEKLIRLSLDTYSKKVDSEYFLKKYPGLPADAVVSQRIKMASSYAAIAGGLSAAAYTGAVALTIGSLGGASPITVPAALSTLVADAAMISQLQLRLAYDIATLYRVPLDIEDPDDLLKLVQVALTIKSGETAGLAVNKLVPALVRPLIKRYFSGSVLAVARGLPAVGKYLLQRNVIKLGIPAIGVPVAIGINKWATTVAGEHARKIFRNEARIIESAEKLVTNTDHPKLLLWIAWLVADADKKFSEDETLLLQQLFAFAKDIHNVVDQELTNVIEVDPEEVWRQIDLTNGDLSSLYDAAVSVAKIDAPLSKAEKQILREIEERCVIAKRA